MPLRPENLKGVCKPLFHFSMRLVDLVKQLPLDWVLAPIYRKGARMVSGKEATGKNPWETAFDKALNRDDVALQLEKREDLAAVGLFTGIRGKGIVILDVDRNLAALKRKWGTDLDGAPVVTSTKKNAAKYIFRVPEELWSEVSGFGHSEDHKDGYEVLFGAQGVIYGAYPGSQDGKWPEGEYDFAGDPEAVPEAPAWLLAEMKAAKAPSTFIKNRTALDLSDRTEDEIAVIITDCLDVIQPRGAGQRDHWIRIGMAIHSVLPDELGLTLWSVWSSKDLDFAHEWEGDKNPCKQPWESFKAGGRIGLGSLIYQADLIDPKRSRFQQDSLKILEAAEAAVQRTREVGLPYDEIIRRGMAAYELDDTSRMNYELHSIAMEARYKDQSGVEKLLMEYITQQTREAGRTMDTQERSLRDFLIPGLLPYGYLLLMYGDPGCGKSATALALMKHVVDGIPFRLKDQLVPVEPGPVIYFNADMSSLDFQEEYDLHEIANGHRFYFEPDFNLYRQAQFVKTMNRVKPSMICIDSLSSCSGSKAGDENKAEFAQPLYWLSAKNGILWPACTIVVLHHAAKATGGARGSTAISAAVSEVWNISHPKKDSGLQVDQRVITVGKSRLNRSGESLIQTQNEDLTVSLVEARKLEELQTRAGTVAERIMNRLQTKNEWLSRQQLNADPLVGGNVSAIRKALQRLVNRGVLEVRALQQLKKGSPELEYRALLVRGGFKEVSHLPQTPCNNSLSKWDSPTKDEKCPTKKSEPGASKWDTSSEKQECPTKESSADAGSDPSGTLSHSPRAREAERTSEEVQGALDKAHEMWD